VAHRFGVTPHALDQARATSEWLEHEHMLTAIRKREYETSRHPAELAGNVLRNMGQAFEEADPIAAAINREFTSFAAELVDEEDDDAECCATCGTELAFAGDVCGICNPGVLPQLQ
jgi:hypothetical protein